MHVFRRDLRRQPQDWLDHGCVSANLPCTIPFAFTGAVLPPTQHVASRVSMCHLGPDFSDAHADGCLHSDGNLPAIRPQSNRNPIAIRSQSDGGARFTAPGLNFGTVVPTSVMTITFAHEVGHNFGSP